MRIASTPLHATSRELIQALGYLFIFNCLRKVPRTYCIVFASTQGSQKSLISIEFFSWRLALNLFWHVPFNSQSTAVCPSLAVLSSPTIHTTRATRHIQHYRGALSPSIAGNSSTFILLGCAQCPSLHLSCINIVFILSCPQKLYRPVCLPHRGAGIHLSGPRHFCNIDARDLYFGVITDFRARGPQTTLVWHYLKQIWAQRTTSVFKHFSHSARYYSISHRKWTVFARFTLLWRQSNSNSPGQLTNLRRSSAC
ncbi:hypothetical protein R3P38DRAFT_243325 [Favolaschia claudopus]|uniref:Uncharacterized protein n=1 Tax=Favolaschia claudopus TaxID=2862362 RepID=A0AAW0CU85_9AGAR